MLENHGCSGALGIFFVFFILVTFLGFHPIAVNFILLKAFIEKGFFIDTKLICLQSENLPPS